MNLVLDRDHSCIPEPSPALPVYAEGEGNDEANLNPIAQDEVVMGSTVGPHVSWVCTSWARLTEGQICATPHQPAAVKEIIPTTIMRRKSALLG